MNAIALHFDRVIAFQSAIRRAEERAAISDFDQHVIEENGEFVVVDEGQYGGLPVQIIDRIRHTVDGRMSGLY